jgi:hypothetical protein
VGSEGPEGPEGPQGPEGPAGPANTIVRLISDNAEDVNAVVQCDAAEPEDGRALGGGLSTEPDLPVAPHDAVVELSAPADAQGNRAANGEQATGWIGRMDAANATFSFTVYAICAVP